MNVKVVLSFVLAALCAALAVEGRRVRRQESLPLSSSGGEKFGGPLRRDVAPLVYGEDKSDPGYDAPHHKGRVGPVYTFVKTDPTLTSSGESDTSPEYNTDAARWRVSQQS